MNENKSIMDVKQIILVKDGEGIQDCKVKLNWFKTQNGDIIKIRYLATGVT